MIAKAKAISHGINDLRLDFQIKSAQKVKHFFC